MTSLPLCLAVRGRRIFSQALLYHLVGNQIFLTMASTVLGRIACVMPGQDLCNLSAHAHWGHPSGHQKPSGQRVPSCLSASPWLRDQQGVVKRSCPLQYPLFLVQIRTIQAHFPVSHQAKGHLVLSHLSVSQLSCIATNPPAFPCL